MTTLFPETKEFKTEIGTAKGSNKKRIAHATAWTMVSYVMGNALRLISNLVLARLLFPEAFALLALAGILTQGLKMFSDIGIGPSIIQSRFGEEPKFLNTAWTLQVIRGAWLFIAACGLAYPFALLYKTPELLWIVPASAFPSIISGFNSTALFTLNRQLAMTKIALLNLGESVVKLVVTIAWAIVDPSVWAILGGVIASRVFYTTASHFWLSPRYRHRFTWDRDAARELLHFGSWVFLSTSIIFCADQADRLMLGKLIPLDQLGVYSIALMFSQFPIQICVTVMGSVAFPALSSIVRTKPGQLAETLVRIRKLILTLGSAATIILMVLSPWFFHLAYDYRYQSAVWMAPLLGFVMWFRILQASCDRALLALGDTRALFLSSIVNFVVTVIACLLGFHVMGIAGFIAGCGMGNLAGHAMIAKMLNRRDLLKIKQDLVYTTIVILAGIFGVWLPSNLSMDLATGEGRIRIIFQGLLGVMAGTVAVTTALKLWNKR